MNIQEPLTDIVDPRTTPVRPAADVVPAGIGPDAIKELERQVESILTDCFFALGQAVGMRMTIDWEAVVFWRERYRSRFLVALQSFGNRWAEDRTNVTGVVAMLGERAVRYAEGKPSIDAEAARKASADVERYCTLHSRRVARARGLSSDDEPVRIAGYWCNYE